MSREMKQSGVPWIGEIPKTWEIRKVKDVFVRKNEKAHQDNPVILSLARAGVKVRDVSTNEGQMAESYYDYNPVEPFDLLVNPMDLYSGANCSMSLVSGVISPAYVNLRAKGGACSRFYDYYFKTQYWSMAFFAHGKGISFDNRWTLGVDTLFRYNVPFPSVLEQQKIASFLDRKCSEIDEMIALQEKIVEELKAYKQSVITEAVTKGLNPDVPMKDSGIEWIGEIPEHWSLLRLKSIVVKIESGVSVNASGDYEEKGGEYVLKTSCVSRNTFIPTECKKVEAYDLHRVDCPVKKDTLIVSRMNTPELVGSCGYSQEDIDNIYLPDRLWQVSLSESVFTKFYWYLLISSSTRNYFSSLSTGTSSSMQNISQPQFNNTPIVIPCIDEQKSIVKHLDTKCTEIDNLISIKLSKIDSLKEYKKSIIYEYVTGKKEVIE